MVYYFQKMRFLHVLVLAMVVAAVAAAPVSDGKVTAVEIVETLPVSKSDPHADYILVGDIQIDPNRNAVFDNHRWLLGQIPYVIDSNYTTEIHNRIITAMREIEHNVNPPSGSPCIKFVPRTNQINYISVYKGTGCHSAVGMTNKGKQDVSLGTGCESKGTMMHELIHALGLWHEQSRYDRNTYLNINLNNVGANEKYNFDLHSSTTTTTLNVPYDFSSIMHYEPYAFAVDKSVPVLTPKSGYGHGVQMGQNLALTKSDVTKLQRLYDCTEDSTHIISPLQSGNVIVDCSFENNTCTLHDDTTGNFMWVRKTGVSSSGPKAGHTNGADPYLIATASGHQGVAKIVTPSTNKGPACVDLYLYQHGTSYLNIALFGPHYAHQVMKTYQNVHNNYWIHSRVNINIHTGDYFQLSLEAHIGTGDVAIDDLHIYHGTCV